MAQGPPNIDNTPLDPGRQALGLVNPKGVLIGTPIGIAPPASLKASTMVLQSKDFISNLGIKYRKLFPFLSNI
jgi:hypothetical protein